ncbi:MAG: class I SAM-dependent methyltransferase, partial [Shewanella sp.]|nr:class I SAM-dependent methyltransferase [Shewanella sp.]
MQAFIEYLDTISMPADSCRLFHGRGGHFMGSGHLCLDWFDPVLLLTSFRELSDQELANLHQDLECFWTRVAAPRPFNLVYQYRAGGQTQTRLLAGEVPERHVVTENGCQFLVHLLRGQNHGLFLDMRGGRKWVKQHSQGKRVLNLFAYTCGFSVAAMAGGAQAVINMDMAKGALSVGKKNHQLNGFVKGVSFLGHDIFNSWGKLRKLGPYDLIIADPPSNQKGSFVATKDYRRLLRKLPELLTSEGELLLCLNAPELSTQFLQDQVAS